MQDPEKVDLRAIGRLEASKSYFVIENSMRQASAKSQSRTTKPSGQAADLGQNRRLEGGKSDLDSRVVVNRHDLGTLVTTG